MKLISVIIPTHQPGDYIIECLNSLANQTLKKEEFEVLIILNGEKEPYFSEIGNHIKKNSLTNFKLFYTLKKGVSNARNIGLDNSKGGYICFIDDDDLISLNYLDKRQKSFSDNTIIVTNLLTFTSSIDTTKKDYIGYKFEKKVENDTLYNNRKFLSAIGGKIISKKIIGNYRFNTNFSNGEDSLFIAKISKRISQITFTDIDVIYYRRLRKNSASRKNKYTLKKRINLIMLLKEYFNLVRKKGYNNKFIFSRIIATMFKIIK